MTTWRPFRALKKAENGAQTEKYLLIFNVSLIFKREKQNIYLRTF
jgi:hypothetical protein